MPIALQPTRYPAHFYTETPGTIEVWNRQGPAGVLSPGRLISGEHAWRTTTQGTVRKKRPLICNITFKSLPREAILEKLGTLMRDGFEVYVSIVSESALRKLVRLTDALLQTHALAICFNSNGVEGFERLCDREKAWPLTHFDMERLIANNPRLICRHLEADDLQIRQPSFEKQKLLEVKSHDHLVLTDPEPLTAGFRHTRLNWSTIITSEYYHTEQYSGYGELSIPHPAPCFAT